ncbi:MAG: peptidoglycan-binding protein [Hyphomicrobiales bacterium]|nr:peptidoglycan-binding protein [Hyphomicrobiales bacterium]
MNWRKPPEIIGRRTKERDLFFDGRWSNDGTMTEFTRLTSNSTPDWSSGKRINVARELKSALGGGGGTPEPLVVGSDEIRAWQRQLASLGFAVGPIDGIAGDKTVAAVKAFQLRQGLTVDGVVGPETRAALDAAVTQPKPDGPGPGAGSSVGFSWRAVVVGAVFIVIVAAIIVFAA